MSGNGDISRGSLTPKQVAEHTDALTRHYGERVAPVSEYCDAFRKWHQALKDKVARIDAGTEQDYGGEQYREIADALDRLVIPIAKSNLLWRLIYGAQPLRTKPCPEHKGQWSGCKWDSYCECMDGSDVTGWLPNHKLSMYDLIARFAKSRGYVAQMATHYPASPLYDAEEPIVVSALGKMSRGASYDEACERLAEKLADDGFVPDEWQPS